MVTATRAVTRAVLFATAVLVLLPLQILVVAISTRLAPCIPRFFHRLCIAIMGIQVRVHGTPQTDPSILYVSNHSSYLDITILGSLLPASFIAKSEISSWPVFGLLAKLQRSVFIKRDRKFAQAQKTIIENRLAKGDSLILFAEGTTSDGCRTLPFMSSLFESAAKAKFMQPVSIVFTELDGIPAGRTLRHIYAWMGDVTLGPHLWEILKQGDLTVDVIFHPALTPSEFANRKIMSETCYNIVSSGVSDLVTGRQQDIPVAQQA